MTSGQLILLHGVRGQMGGSALCSPILNLFPHKKARSKTEGETEWLGPRQFTSLSPPCIY